MNFKKNWKRFWTLSRGTEGFTLVELIVVIAILAILAGVAVPAYSGYIKKANMTSDQTMVADLEKALALGYYSGELSGSSGYIVLSTEGVVNRTDIAEGSALDNVLTATYGDNWESFLMLKHADWDAVVLDMLDPETAKDVANSSFATGSTPTQLMGTVSSLTVSIADALATKNPTDKVNAIKNNVTDESWNAVTSQLGIEDASKLSNTELSNLALLLVANEMSSESYNPENPSTLANIVNTYANYSGYIYSGYATDEDKATFNEVTNNLMNLQVPEGTGVTSYVTTELDKFANFNENALLQYAPETGGAAQTDGSAFTAMMNGLNQGSSVLDASDLKDASLTTDGVIGNYFNQYMDAATVLSGMPEGTAMPTLNQGEVAVIFSGVNVYSTID